MTLREYTRHLQTIIRENPKARDMIIIAAGDVEGNSFEEVFFGPSMVYFDGEQIDMSGENEVNAVCLN